MPDVNPSGSDGGDEVHRDLYGFAMRGLTAEDAAARAACDARQAHHAREWARGWLGRPDRVWRSIGTLKRHIRRGIPPEHRADVWWEVSGAAQRCQQAGRGYYHSLLAKHATDTSRHLAVIELDLPRTFPEQPWVASNAGMAALRRVLTAFSWHCQRVGYCQSLNYVAALLLLVLPTEERAFWVLATLLECVLYRDMHTEDLLGCHVEMRVLWALLHKKMPVLAAHLKSVDFEMSMVSTEWLLTVFVKSVPAETAARILDCTLCEGSKVLYRVALALFKTNEEQLLRAEHIGDVVQTLRGCTAHAHDRDGLMWAAFHGIGSLKMRSIRSRRTIHQPLVEAELRLRAQQQAQFQQQREAKATLQAAARAAAATPIASASASVALSAGSRNDAATALVSHALSSSPERCSSSSDTSIPAGSPVLVRRRREQNVERGWTDAAQQPHVERGGRWLPHGDGGIS